MAALQIVSLMQVMPATEDDKAGKAALFTKYVEALPHALDSWKDAGLGLISQLLLGIQRTVSHNTTLHQNLFRSDALHIACCASLHESHAKFWLSLPNSMSVHICLAT